MQAMMNILKQREIQTPQSFAEALKNYQYQGKQLGTNGKTNISQDELDEQFFNDQESFNVDCNINEEIKSQSSQRQLDSGETSYNERQLSDQQDGKSQNQIGNQYWLSIEEEQRILYEEDRLDDSNEIVYNEFSDDEDYSDSANNLNKEQTDTDSDDSDESQENQLQGQNQQADFRDQDYDEYDEEYINLIQNQWSSQ
ncbi:UNKNOWN [Stylonychia lemnae]|uniref:Uncharacterized protein n=1 Tax=Stylonychia lemnae TaxID=5949 RepID=A0A078B6L4_STYLE|nr:UNKNOWN [Stylonychia lemnae]|eukprot:CDW88917.1 UNKNOWN [Stylonychia lemnae]